MKNDILRLGVILFIITAVAASLLGVVNQMTSPVIAAQIAQANNLARQNILTKADSFEIIDQDFGPDIIEVYRGLSGSNVVGYTIKTAPGGYSGEIETTTGITLDGVISGVSIGTMTETPGLGAKAQDEEFISQFDGKDASENIEVIKNGQPANNQIVAISGATITSSAVTRGVNTSLELFKEALE